MANDVRDQMQKGFDAGAGPEAVPGDGGFTGAPETLRRLDSPGRRLSLSELQDLLATAKRNLAEVDRIGAKATAEVEGVDSRWTDDARRMATSEIRNRAHAAALEQLPPVNAAAGEAERQRALYDPAVLARAAAFSDDPVAEAALRSSWQARAAGADVRGLQALALLAASTSNVAAGVVVADELRRRDAQPGDRRAVLDLLPSPAPAAELAVIEEISSTWRGASWRLQELRAPGSSTVSRMEAAFADKRAGAA